jgi:hypothetical protein
LMREVIPKIRTRSGRIGFRSGAVSVTTGEGRDHLDGGNPCDIEGMASLRRGGRHDPSTPGLLNVAFHQSAAIEKIDGH